MLVRSVRRSIFPLAALALSSSLALSSPAQAPQPPAQAAPPSTSAPAPAPAERRPSSGPHMRSEMQRGMRPGMQDGMRPGGMRGNMRGGVMQQHGNFRGGFHGGPDEGFRGGSHGPMGADFRIAPAGTWWKSPRVVQRLSLTAEQTKKMDDIVQQSRLQLIDLRANLEKQQLMLEPMLSANPLDTAKTSAQIDKVAQARADLEKSDARMLLGIRGVLTPDQWTKLHERPAPDAAPAGGAGAPPAASGAGPGRWRGARSGAPGGGNGMDNLVAPIDAQ